MEKQEVHKLFNLLETLHAGQKRPRDIGTLSAWADVLALWTYEEVREAAIKRAQKGNRYFPDAAELIEYLPHREDQSWMYKYIEARMTEAEKRAAEHAARIREKYHAVGLPTPSEAKRLGLKFSEWKQLVYEKFPDGVPDLDEEEVCESET